MHRTKKENNKVGLFAGRNYIFLAAVIILTSAVFFPSINNSFVNWDDPEYIFENENIKSLDFKFIRWCLEAVVVSNWHPITMFSHALDYAVWGMNPAGHHLSNIIFHTLNTFLVFVLVFRLVSYRKAKHLLTSEIEIFSETFIIAIIASILFGIHPLHVESVTWLSERKDVLSTFFYLLSLIVYTKYLSTDSKGLPHYVLCLISFVLALMSKPMAISLPIVLIILDFYPYQRIGKNMAKALNIVLIEKIPFIITTLIFIAVTISTHSNMSLHFLPMESRIAISAFSYFFYLVKILLPFNLAHYYPNPFRLDPLEFQYLVSYLFLFIFTSLSILALKWSRFALAIWLYYVITLLPVVGLVQSGGMVLVADRYAYLPSVGPFLLMGVITAKIIKGLNSKSCHLAVLLIFCAFGMLSYGTLKQIAVWHDDVSLWSHEIKVVSKTTNVIRKNYMQAYSNRGANNYLAGKYEDAVSDFNKALDHGIPDPDVFYNRGLAYLALEDYRSSIADFDRAVMLAPNFADAYKRKGEAFSRLANMEEANINYKKAADLESKKLE